MPTIVHSGFGPIILAVKARLVSELEIDATMVKIVARERDTVPKLNGDRDVVLKVGSFIHQQGVYQGAGRTVVRLTRWFDAICRMRNALDDPQSDESKLTDEDNDLGLLPWEEAVFLTICGFCPKDSAGNELVVHEIRVFDGEPPTLPQTMREWVGSCLRFEVEYMLLKDGSPLT